MFCKHFLKVHTQGLFCSNNISFKNLQTIIRRNASSINFEAAYTSPNGSRFKILPMMSEDKEETYKLLAHEFSTREPLCVCLGLTYSEILYFAKIVGQRALEENLGTVIKDSKGRIVAANLCVDQYNFEKNPVDISGVSEKVLDMMDMLEQCHPPSIPTKEKEIITSFATAVMDDPELQNQKLAHKIKSFTSSEHPILSKINKLTSQAINPKMVTVNKKLGWKVVNVYDVKKYVNQKGKGIYKNIDQVSEKLFDSKYPGIYVFEYSSQHKDSV